MKYFNYLTRYKSGSWIRENDIFPWFKKLIWSLSIVEHKVPAKILIMRIFEMYKSQGLHRRNFRFVHTYLKEAYTVALANLSGTKYQPKILVAIGKGGLPLIIPGRLRAAMLSGDRLAYTLTLTILAIHRLIPWWPAVDLSTVVAPFEGVTKSLAIELISKAKIRLCTLAGMSKRFTLRISVSPFLELQSASPNGKVSVDSLVLDALAFWRNLPYLYSLLMWFWLNKSYLHILIILILMIFGWPLAFRELHIGRLGVVYNVAGKSRIIGITNYWVQCALFPLHKEIFRFLKKLKTDGTFDQLLPLSFLEKGKTYFSYDLSAATDRLPRDLQIDVLKVFLKDKRFADLWGNLVNIPFYHKGQYYYYSVGQPMGAYSSWAMLALTHHVIVNACVNASENYCVLGDDVVVDGSFASEYFNFMQLLGVKISLGKSIVSNQYVEFAKKVLSITGEDYSVIGPGLILACVRNKYLTAMLLYESYKRDFIKEWEIPRKLYTLQSLLGIKVYNVGRQFLFGFKGLVTSTTKFEPLTSLEASWYASETPQNLTFETTNFISLREMGMKRWEKGKEDSIRACNSLSHDMWRSSLNRFGFLGCLHFLLLWFTPYPYFTIGRVSSVLSQEDFFTKFRWTKPSDGIGLILDELREGIIYPNDPPLVKKDIESVVSFYKEFLSVSKRMRMFL
jgi:hypothetical protein